MFLLTVIAVSAEERVILIQSDESPVITRTVTTTTQNFVFPTVTLPTITIPPITTTTTVAKPIIIFLPQVTVPTTTTTEKSIIDIREFILSKLTTTTTELPKITIPTITLPKIPTTTTTLKPLVYNNVVSIEQYSFSNCQCMPTMYEFIVKNTGNFMEAYTFSVEPFSKGQYFFNKPSMILQPGNSDTVKLTVILPCDEVGFYEGVFISKTRTSNIKSKTYFYLSTNECFDYNTTLTAYEPVIVNGTVKGKKLQDVEDKLEICAQENTTLVVNLDNKDSYINYYDLDFTELAWITMENDTVSVPSDSTASFDITLAPGPEDVGIYNFSLHLTPVLGTQEQDKNIIIEVAECYKFSVELADYAEICAKPTEFNITVSNQGQFKEKIELKVDTSWAKIVPNMADIEPDNSTVFELSLTPPDETGNATIIINTSLVNRNITQQNELYLNLISLQECYQVEFIDKTRKTSYGPDTPKFRIRNIGHESTTYKITSISGIGDWAGLLTDVVELGAGEKGKFWIATDATEDIPGGSYPFLITLESSMGQEYSQELMLRVGSSNYLWSQFKKFWSYVFKDLGKLGKSVSGKNKGPLYHEWSMNKVYELDLSVIFYDPDLDSLTFTVTETENINIELEDTKFILTPLQDWTGTETIQITADDGQGGIATTPDIPLVVS